MRDHTKLKSWDKTHLHFEVYDRNEGGRKRHRWDPYGIYGKAPLYKSKKSAMTGNLWLIDDKRNPVFIRLK